MYESSTYHKEKQKLHEHFWRSGERIKKSFQEVSPAVWKKFIVQLYVRTKYGLDCIYWLTAVHHHDIYQVGKYGKWHLKIAPLVIDFSVDLN